MEEHASAETFLVYQRRESSQAADQPSHSSVKLGCCKLILSRLIVQVSYIFTAVLRIKYKRPHRENQPLSDRGEGRDGNPLYSRPMDASKPLCLFFSPLCLGLQVHGADELPVKAVRNPRGQLDGRLQLHVRGVDDQELRLRRPLVVHEDDDVSVGFFRGRLLAGRYEVGLPTVAALTVQELGDIPRGEVHLGEARNLGPWVGDGEVSVPRPPPHPVGVHHAGLQVQVGGRGNDGPA